MADIFQSVFVSENVRIAIKSSLKFVPEWPVNHIPALFR